jgi:hypothetical protein
MLKVYEMSSYVLVRFVLTHPLSYFCYVLPYLMLGSALVSINLCNPCDQGRVDITIEHMYLYAGNKFKKFIFVVVLHPLLYVCDSRKINE